MSAQLQILFDTVQLEGVTVEFERHGDSAFVKEARPDAEERAR